METIKWIKTPKSCKDCKYWNQYNKQCSLAKCKYISYW